MFFDETGRPLAFSDATIEDAVRGIGALELSFQESQVKVERQRLLDGLEAFLYGILDREEFTFGNSGDAAGNPLGINFLEGVTVQTLPFLKGFVLAVSMDNWENRQRTAAHFQVTLQGEPLILGGGQSCLVNLENFTRAGLTEQAASSNIFEEREIERLRQAGVIVSESENARQPRPVSVYFRRMSGLGVSDDAALVYIGKTYGKDAMFGALLADAADTYDKYLETYAAGGNDELIVRRLLERLGQTGDFVTDQEIRRLIYFSAKANHPPLDVSSSHRRLIQIEPGARVPTFLNHLAYVRGRKTARIPLGYNRLDSEKFYRGVTERASILRLGWQSPPPGEKKKRVESPRNTNSKGASCGAPDLFRLIRN
jgi:hypothetical protein